LGFVLTSGWVETFVAAYFAKSAGIAKWRQASVVEARAEKQVKTRIGRMILQIMQRIVRYSACRFRQMERVPPNWHCVSFLVGWRGQMHVLLIPFYMTK
jgi:hypothetical protein